MRTPGTMAPLNKTTMKNILTLLLLAMLAACGRGTSSPGAYLQWVENEANGLRQTRTIGDIKVSLQYKPVDYIVAAEQKTSVLDKPVKTRRNELEGAYYFSLRYALSNGKVKDIMRYDLADEAEYQDRMNYFSFGLQNDIFLVAGKDTLPCVLYNNTRSYGLSPFMDAVIAFPRTHKENDDLQLVVNDHVFGSGPLKFTISKSDIESTPTISTN